MKPVLLTLVLAIAAEGQQAEKLRPGRVEGLVRNAEGQALPWVELMLEGPEEDDRRPLSATTDQNGRFRFTAVPPARDYFLTAHKPGYADARYGGPAGTPLTVEPGAAINDVVIRMQAQGVITGRVLDPAGDPVTGAQVIALRPVYQRGERRLTLAGRVLADDRGVYRIANLAPGNYYVRVNGRVLPAGGALGMTYFSSAASARDATPVRIDAGTEARAIDLRMRKQRVFAIRGRVVDARGEAANGTLVSLLPPDQAMVVEDVTRPLQPARKPDASFEFRGLAPGTYFLQTLPGVRMNNVMTPRLIGRLQVTITDRDVEGAALVVGPGVSVSGSVKVEGSGTIPVSVELEEAAGAAMNTPGAEEAAADGSFHIDGAAPVPHTVRVNGMPANVYLKSVRFEGAETGGSPVDLARGGTLELVLSPKAAGITGIVRDPEGKARAAAPVALWTASGAKPRRTATDQNGAFEFLSLPPGEYFLAAWEAVDPGLLEYQPFLAGFAADAAKLALRENAHAAVEVPVMPAAKIEAAIARLP